MLAKVLFVSMLILAGQANQVAPIPRPALTDDGLIRLKGHRLVITAMNNSGAMIGYFDGVDGLQHAFFYLDKEFREITPPVNDGSSIVLHALNNKNRILFTQDGVSFIYDVAQTTFFPIGGAALIAGQQPQLMENIVGLNDQGEILFRTFPGRQIAYGLPALGVSGSLRPPAEAHAATTIPMCSKTEALPAEPIAINNSDEIIGSCKQAGAFLYSGGTMHFIAPPDSIFVVPVAINNRGIVVGYSQFRTGGRRVFIYRDGKISMPQMVPASYGLTEGVVNGINDQNQVVLFVRGGAYVTALPEVSQ